MLRKQLLIGIVCALLIPFFSASAQMESRQVQTVIHEIIQSSVNEDGSKNYQFKAESPYGEIFTVDTKHSYENGLWYELKPGNKVNVRIVETSEKNDVYFEDIIRTNPLWIIMGVFMVITVAVGLLRGLYAVIGFFITIGILFGYLFPQILAGTNPFFVTAISSVVILGVNIHLAHGFKLRTFFSFLGTIVGVILTAIFAYVFTISSSISGLGTEEATLLFWDVPTIVDPVTIFLCAILIGAVGVLDDIAVTQSEIVEELESANPDLSRKELYKRAMRIGRHHIASTVNTLILVYVGAAMPTFLLATHYSIGTQAFLNTEVVAEEIVRIMAGTSALVLTVPIATVFSTIPRNKKKKTSNVPRLSL